MKSVPNDTYAIFLPAENIPVGLYVLFIGKFSIRTQHIFLEMIKLKTRTNWGMVSNQGH